MSAEAPVDPYVDHREWQRLDPLMLLVHPVRELGRFLLPLVGILLAGTASGGHEWWWNVVGVAIPVSLGVAKYLTTSFRIADGRVELRHGLLNKHVLSTPVDRVRTVDVTASPVHRLLGLTTVRIGTGTASTKGEDELDLDGLRARAAEALRADLLHGTPAARERAAAAGGADGAAGTGGPRPVARFEPGWLRFAPFTSSGLVIAAAIVGAGSQLLNGLDQWERLPVDETAEQAGRLSLVLLVPVLLVGLAVVASVLAVIGYLVTNYGFTLVYTRADHAWHLRRGLLTTRETSMDATRLRGVSLGEPLGLRLASGARLSAIVTGLDREDRGSGTLVPPAPRDLVTGVAAQVLGTPGPVSAPLVGHGPAATRRRFVRALAVPALVSVAAVALVLGAGAPWETLMVVPLALATGYALAVDRSRTLGHALVDGHVVSRAGSLVRRRVALDTQAVIGWTFSDTWFQRRAGLTTLVATTAGGRQSVTFPDVPEDVGTALARDAVPGLVSQFLDEGPPGRVLEVPPEVAEADT